MHGSGDKIIAANSFLAVLEVVLVFLLYFLILLAVGGGREVEGKNSRGFLQVYVHILFQVIDCQLPGILLGLLLLFLGLRL